MSPIVFDVGANTGQTTSAILRVLPGAIVHAFEPHPGAFEGMRRLSMMQKNVVLNNCALGAQPGEQTLFENTSSDMSSLLPLGQDGWEHVQARRTVKVSTVDEYCAHRGIPRIDLLKSDTQGFELEVLKGASRMLERNLVHLIDRMTSVQKYQLGIFRVGLSPRASDPAEVIQHEIGWSAQRGTIDGEIEIGS